MRSSKSLETPAHTATLPPRSAIKSTATDPIDALWLSIRAGKSLPETPLTTCPKNATPFTSLACGAPPWPAPPANASSRRNCATSFASVLRSSTKAATRPSKSGIGAFNALASPETTALCCARCAEAAAPVNASTRRTPALLALSDKITNPPISPVCATCVPPQSSKE